MDGSLCTEHCSQQFPGNISLNLDSNFSSGYAHMPASGMGKLRPGELR